MDQTLNLSKDTRPKPKVKGLNSLLILCCMGIGFAWTALMSLVVIALFWINPKWGHNGERLWARGWCRLLGIRVQLVGEENLPKAGGILAPNHSSMWDILVLSTLPVDFKYISKRQVRRLPFLGYCLNVMGTYWLNRDKSGKDIAVMKRVEDGLRAGIPVLIFPEGTRTRTGELLPFKKGAFRTAINSGSPLCPIAISGTFDIAPPGQLPLRRGHDVVIRVGAPFIADPAAPLEQVSDDFRAKLVGLLEMNRSRSVV
jgi:1-acyl-sn-glycerol-3-phosphate acyltransferase